MNDEAPLAPPSRGGRGKRVVRWAVGLGVRVSLLVTPRPAALLVRKVFAMGGAQLNRSLDEHAPPGVAVIADERYGDEGDMLLDVVRPTSVTERLPLVQWDQPSRLPLWGGPVGIPSAVPLRLFPSAEPEAQPEPAAPWPRAGRARAFVGRCHGQRRRVSS